MRVEIYGTRAFVFRVDEDGKLDSGNYAELNERKLFSFEFYTFGYRNESKLYADLCTAIVECVKNNRREDDNINKK